MKKYIDEVIAKYQLLERMVFSTEVLRCVWSDESQMWTIFLKDLKTERQYVHQCQVLFSAAGQLVEPRPCDIPGWKSFHGPLFHSARWNHDVNLANKKVVVIGNGCKFALVRWREPIDASC
jgi:cation diffusion facilitator CzcD-associated flavoprotein CzcO